MDDIAHAPRSALPELALPGRHGRPDGEPGVQARLLEPLSIALLMPTPGAPAACLERLAAVYGAALAQAAPRRAVRGSGLDLAWAGPDRWVATIPADVDIEAVLGEVCGATASIVDQSDGRFVLRLRGPRVRDTLARGVAIDLHARAFQPDDTALLQLAHLQVQLTMVDDAPTFDIIGPRAAAGDIWHWLVGAAAQYGLEVQAQAAADAAGDPPAGQVRHRNP